MQFKDSVKVSEIIGIVGVFILGILAILSVSTIPDPEYKDEQKGFEEQKLLSQEGLAQYLGISKAEATDLESEIPNKEIKGKIYFPKAEVDEWLGEK